MEPIPDFYDHNYSVFGGVSPSPSYTVQPIYLLHLVEKYFRNTTFDMPRHPWAAGVPVSSFSFVIVPPDPETV